MLIEYAEKGYKETCTTEERGRRDTTGVCQGYRTDRLSLGSQGFILAMRQLCNDKNMGADMLDYITEIPAKLSTGGIIGLVPRQGFN